VGQRFWKLILLRAVWFLLAAGCLVLALVVVLQHLSGPAVGTDYSATITAKTVIADAAAGDPVCRLTVDPAGAPEESDAPTRILSPTACAALPAVGDPVGLTFVQDAQTVVTGDATRPARVAPWWVAGALGAAMLGFIALFWATSRSFNRALESFDDPGQPSRS
jgi:hypothetical protein